MLEHIGVAGHRGLFVVHDAVGLQSLAQFCGGVGIQQGVNLNNDVHVGAASLAGCCDALNRTLQVMLAVAATDLGALGSHDIAHGSRLGGSKNRVNLDRVVTLVNRFFDDTVVILRVIQQSQAVLGLNILSPAELQLRSVCAELIVGLAAQQLVNGNTESLTLDIPAGDIDRSHGGGNNDAAAHTPEGVAMQVLPNLLCVERIHTEDQFAKILALAKCSFCRLAVSQARLAPAINAGIGVDLHGNKAADRASAQITFDTRDFHTWNLHSNGVVI